MPRQKRKLKNIENAPGSDPVALQTATASAKEQKEEKMRLDDFRKREEEYNEFWRKVLYFLLAIVKWLIWQGRFKELDFLRYIITGLLVASWDSELRNHSKGRRRRKPKRYYYTFWAAFSVICDCVELDMLMTAEKHIPKGFPKLANQLRYRIAFTWLFSYSGTLAGPHHRILKNDEDIGGAIGGIVGLVLAKMSQLTVRTTSFTQCSEPGRNFLNQKVKSQQAQNRPQTTPCANSWSNRRTNY